MLTVIVPRRLGVILSMNLEKPPIEQKNDAKLTFLLAAFQTNSMVTTDAGFAVMNIITEQ